MGIHERLWGSVIIQAMADIEEGKRIEYYEKYRPRVLKDRSITKRKEVVEYAKDAADWFKDYGVGVGSLQWICDVCDFDADRIRAMSYTVEGRRYFLKHNPRVEKETEDLNDDPREKGEDSGQEDT